MVHIRAVTDSDGTTTVSAVLTSATPGIHLAGITPQPTPIGPQWYDINLTLDDPIVHELRIEMYSLHLAEETQPFGSLQPLAPFDAIAFNRETDPDKVLISIGYNGQAIRPSDVTVGIDYSLTRLPAGDLLSPE